MFHKTMLRQGRHNRWGWWGLRLSAFQYGGALPLHILGQVRHMRTSGKAESARFKLADGEEADVA